jgi:hypothetical protein
MKRIAAALVAVSFAATLGLVEGCGRSSLGEVSLSSLSDASTDGTTDGSIDGPEGGPDGSHGCRSNKDCASTPSTPFCEIPPGKCVACEVTAQCPAGDVCRENQCVQTCGPAGECDKGLSCCGDLCVDEQTNPEDCGSCNFHCVNGEACVAASCRLPTGCNGGAVCSPEDQCCNSGCSNTNSDPLNCGHCQNRCDEGATCVAGACHTPTSCEGGPACTGVQTCCTTGCADTSSDPQNCGKCGFACGPDATCVESKCVNGPSCHGEPACTGSESCCADGCTDTSDDPTNCGRCGKACAAGETCSGGKCQSTAACNMGPPCMTGLECCPSGCTDTSGDPQNCGMCGKACAPDATCVGGICRPANSCNGGPACTGSEQCCGTGCANTTTDDNNCGKCGKVCPLGESCISSTCTPVTTCNSGPACVTGQTCCPSGCTDTSSDQNHCGDCTTVCNAPTTCTDGFCVDNEGGLNPFVNPTYLTPGVHNYTTIDIPAGVTVYVAGGGANSGTLQLNATGAVIIAGTIDVSGGPGTQNSITSESTQSGSAGSGGYTGEPYQSASPSMPCGYVSGNPGLLGFAGEGTAGGCTIYTGCSSGFSGPLVFTAILATYGGGAGIFTGFRAYGSGGGGPAGGAPGALGAAYPGETDCAGVAGSGGAVAGQGALGGGAPYDGHAGISGATQCSSTDGGISDVPPAYVGGGGGGSIGQFASADLGVVTTFQTGSGGGGGSADYLNRPKFGGSSGGGGGGGALRISTTGTMTITGQVFANGGKGGDAFIGTGKVTGCDPQPGAGGGGGSGGIIYLSAPTLSVSSGATISAVGGAGGAQSEFATGGGGGAGGTGRIRMSVGTCTSSSGTFNPPLAAGCNPSSKSGTVFVAAYPN